jgi:hypothetical protein
VMGGVVCEGGVVGGSQASGNQWNEFEC